MIGDSQSSDINGGRAAGMFTVWLDPENNDPKPLSADLKVRDLRELLQLWQEARRDTSRSSWRKNE
jgi:FMN phosphatase YigB (HAD superfamily)